MKSACVMLTKCPSEGVKTRLGDSIGQRDAAQIHMALALYMGQVIQASRLPFYVSFKGALDAPLASHFRDMGAHVFAQAEGDLGARIYDAFELANRVVVVGSDCPWITAKQLQAAAVSSEIVIGPAEDGGYYLIAASRPPKQIFEDITWSTKHVLEQTLQKCRSLSCSVIQQDIQYDIDTIHDLNRALQSSNLPPYLHKRLMSYARSQ